MAHSVNADKYHYGMDADIQAKISSKWNQADAETCLKWVGELSGASLGKNFHEALKDGVALCKAMNAIVPNAIKKINTMKMPFMQRENIVAFLDACKTFGLRDSDLFVTQDLFEGDNLVAVVDAIFALGGQAKSKNFRGPTIGVKLCAGDKSKHVEIPSSGTTSSLSRINQGSYGYQDESVNKSIGREIIKSTEASTTAVSRQTQGSYGYQDESVNKSIGREIIKSTEASTTAVSRQTQGSYGYQDDRVNKSIGREIIKTNAVATSVPSRQTTGHTIEAPRQTMHHADIIRGGSNKPTSTTSSTPVGSSIAARRAAFEKK